MPRAAAVAGDGDIRDHHKLCGYLRLVLAAAAAPHPAPSTACSLVKDGPHIGFRTDDGVLLLPIGDPNAKLDAPAAADVSHSSSKKKRKGVPWMKKRRRGARVGGGATPTTPTSVVQLNRSGNVLHQLHTLTGNRYLRIDARVLRVGFRDGEVRAVVLVDVYLPIAAWSGWQFPRSGGIAAALFKHVSCNWEARSSFLAYDWIAEGSHVDDEFLWSYSTCYVLGCEKHSDFDFGKKRLFDLYEIFRSLPAVGKEEVRRCSRIMPEESNVTPGIWDLSDDVLTSVLSALGSKDLVRVAATCRHLRSLAAPIMPCMKLKLFPHQEAAVEWMLKREHDVQVLPHPLYMNFSTEDGFPYYLNAVSGEILTGMAPTLNDFRGGLFCDEPGLGKTVSALSLIMKTHGTLADPPPGVDVIWCMHNPDQRSGYYELSADDFAPGKFMSTWKRFIGQDACRGNSSLELSTIDNSEFSSLKHIKSRCTDLSVGSTTPSCSKRDISSCPVLPLMLSPHILRRTRSLTRVKRNHVDTYGKSLPCGNKRKAALDATAQIRQVSVFPRLSSHHKKHKKNSASHSDLSETWVQCDACRKWRKLLEVSVLDSKTAWFCSMNIDPSYRSCMAPQESWDKRHRITYLPGFYTKGTPQGREQNIFFFTNVLKEHFTLFDSETKKALTWLSGLSYVKLLEMETVGITSPVIGAQTFLNKDTQYGYYKIFHALGLQRVVEKGSFRCRWHYPGTLDNLAFDSAALKIALTKRLDLFRLYLSRATLVVVPANLVDHWKTQIEKHVRPGQLRVYIWADNRKPCAHNLAWDYDIVITTFSRLSADWGPHKKSILMQVHWLRVVLDEGHTLGSSLSLTNKLQLAISVAASNRWILTGTPTPNTPSSHVAHLQPMLKFLHEEAYGQNQESWEAGIVRPFESRMEEGRFRLLQLLRRTMISARKSDLKNIPPCIKKVTFLHFTEEHARSYNELVVTVQRNILMADWKDPSHVESLLNPKQWKFRSNTIRNVRLSCCVAGHIKVSDAGQDIQETMDILVQQGLDPLSDEYTFIRSSLIDGCCCFRCKDWCRLPVITPCRHLLCLDCAALESEKCSFPGCGNPYEMQSPEILTRPENPNPKWPVPKDLIELQPSYKQDDWDPDWQSTSSSKVAYLVGRLNALQESNRNNGNCTERIGTSGGWCSQSNSGMLPFKPSGKLCAALPEKVIIFSQFLEHIHVIEQQLAFAEVGFALMYSPMPSSKKMKSLQVFQEDPNCIALLMNGSAALGLDLSFVTHVFLMEPIWDRSMEEQVISRAHRMGATRPIFVETLAMHGTIEEQMVEFLQDSDVCRRTLKQEISSTDCRTHAPRTLHDFAESNYLAQLSFVRTNTKLDSAKSNSSKGSTRLASLRSLLKILIDGKFNENDKWHFDALEGTYVFTIYTPLAFACIYWQKGFQTRDAYTLGLFLEPFTDTSAHSRFVVCLSGGICCRS